MALNFLTMDLASVTVRVGEADASVDITVYRNMLSAVSPYFRGAFEGSFVEATDRFMSLTDVTEQTFPIDVQSGREKPKELKEMEGLCHKNSEWINRYGLSVLSFLRLYVFADKYDVPQLRDDVLTALVAQSVAWSWWPDIERELIESACANLPPSSKFIRLLVLSTAYCWLFEPGTCSATRVRALREMNEDFAFDSMAVQNERLKKTQSSEGMPAWLWQALPNSCTLHEHLARDAAKCRLRIRDQPYIFTGLVEMCVQDAVSMAKESDEKHTSHKEKD
ncbi:hypothetical protein J4E89_006533 [Alternaria sp. Ai002NY15]|nr:hypothetical protein J4E89_006533 [Alternaria sp. Ai002NY15]